jgi:hypothetical protein
MNPFLLRVNSLQLMCCYHDETHSVPTKAILPVMRNKNATGTTASDTRRWEEVLQWQLQRPYSLCCWFLYCMYGVARRKFAYQFGSIGSSKYCQNTRWCTGRGISLPTDLSQQLWYYRYLYLHIVLNHCSLLSTWIFILTLLLSWKPLLRPVVQFDFLYPHIINKRARYCVVPEQFYVWFQRSFSTTIVVGLSSYKI